jgi:glycosyltransferase involved in cell wall biosynthesis
MSDRVNGDFPRVLLVGAAPLSSIDATGITLANLFGDWPKAQIAQIYDSDNPPDSKVCVRFWRFTSEDIPIVSGARRLLSWKRCAVSPNVVHTDFATQNSKVTAKLLAAFSDIAPFRLPKGMADWVGEFKPDVIYTVLGSVRMMNIVLDLSKQFNIPVIPHFMDDWPATTYARQPLLALPRLVLNRKLKSILARSYVGLTICDDMSVEFSRRYKKRFVAFMNCVQWQDRKDASAPNDHQIITFGYAGGLHLNRWKSLVGITQALQGLKDAGVAVALEIYAPAADIVKYSSCFEEYSVVQSFATLHAYEICEKLSTLDVLLHVESFLQEDSQYTRLSVSTKIPQYMISARPILAYGPEFLSSIRYVRNTGAGLVVTSEDDVPALSEAASALIRAPKLRAQLGENGRRLACERHDATKERPRFLSFLAQAAGFGGTR